MTHRPYEDMDPYPAEKAAEERSWPELGPDLPEHRHHTHQCSGYCQFWPDEVWHDPDGWETHEGDYWPRDLWRPVGWGDE